MGDTDAALRGPREAAPFIRILRKLASSTNYCIFHVPSSERINCRHFKLHQPSRLIAFHSSTISFHFHGISSSQQSLSQSVPSSPYTGKGYVLERAERASVRVTVLRCPNQPKSLMIRLRHTSFPRLCPSSEFGVRRVMCFLPAAMIASLVSNLPQALVRIVRIACKMAHPSDLLVSLKPETMSSRCSKALKIQTYYSFDIQARPSGNAKLVKLHAR